MHPLLRRFTINTSTMGRLTLASVSNHLTDEVIDKVFKFKTQSEESVKNVEVTRAAPAGEGLISAVYRIRVTGKNHTASFVAKGLVHDLLLRKTLRCAEFFKREALFFSKILPILIENQRSLGAKENIQNNLPICYGCHIDGKDDYILMEDLSERKFKTLSEHPVRGERDITLKVLAHFHSVSLALRIKKCDVFVTIANELSELYYNHDNRDWYAKYLQEAINIDRNVLAEMEGTNSIYYQKFEKVTNEDVYGELIRLASTRGDHPTVNHGDAWCPNFLSCKENIVAIDFQLLRCASPATDLAYFIILCSNLCHSKEDFFKAVDVYYQALEYYLQDMGLDPNNVFPLDTLKEELKKYGLFGILAAITSFPLMANERCDVLQSFETQFSNYDRIPLEKIWQLSPITSEKHKLRLVNAVRVAVDVGLI